jgi:hypothetical protein
MEMEKNLKYQQQQQQNLLKDSECVCGQTRIK